MKTLPEKTVHARLRAKIATKAGQVTFQLFLAAIMLAYAAFFSSIPWLSTLTAGFCIGLAFFVWLEK